MAQNTYKTGEKAPESGTYKVQSLVSGGSNQDNTEVKVEKGEQFPPSPSSNEAAHWVKNFVITKRKIDRIKGKP